MPSTVRSAFITPYGLVTSESTAKPGATAAPSSGCVIDTVGSVGVPAPKMARIAWLSFWVVVPVSQRQAWTWLLSHDSPVGEVQPLWPTLQYVPPELQSL